MQFFFLKLDFPNSDQQSVSQLTRESESCEPDLLKVVSGIPDKPLPPSGEGEPDLQVTESLDTVVGGVGWQEKTRGSDVRKEITVFGSVALDCGRSRSGVLM